jgi:hypothetical protein
MIAAVDAGEERAETPVLVAPAADDNFVTGPAFRFGPIVIAA